MSKSPDAFRTISEVADWLGIQAHVLRFWESKFSQVKPVKRAGGRRYYRPADMQLLGGIQKLLHDDGITIKGVQKILREQGIGHVSTLSAPLADNLESPAEQATQSPAAEEPMVKEATDPVTTPEPPQADVTPEPPAPVTATPTPEPLSEPEPDTPAEPEQEELPLAAFVHRPASAPEPEPTAPETTAEVATEAQPEEHPEHPDETKEQPHKIVAMVVDAPDPPDESELVCDPGVLADLQKLNGLNSRHVHAMKPVLQALDEWFSKVSGAA